MGIKCFLVEKTGQSKEEEYEWSGGKGSRKVYEYRRTDTGETRFICGPWDDRAFGVGAMWFTPAIWVNHPEWEEHYREWTNDDGKHLLVLTPGGSWDIDSRASNCTLKDDKTHRCWVRHGDAPNIHVDKSGHTCGAGAGSIICGNYHGFLHHGELTNA